jgi:type VI secretion system protein ImpB
MSSINNKLERVRKPRVHIKYDIETEDGNVEKELPFIVGVMGDFSGNPTKALKPLKDRKFINIDKDNFNDVMQHQTPGVNIRVDNKLADNKGGLNGDMDAQSNSEISVELKFNSLEDFEPENIVAQVPELKKLKEARDKLRDLLSKSDRSDRLENILEETLKDPSKLATLADELGLTKSEE